MLADRVIRVHFAIGTAPTSCTAPHTAGVMAHHRHTQHILAEFKRKGFVWQRSVNYPERYPRVTSFARSVPTRKVISWRATLPSSWRKVRRVAAGAQA